MKFYVYHDSEMVLSRKIKEKIIFELYFRFCPTVRQSDGEVVYYFFLNSLFWYSFTFSSPSTSNRSCPRVSDLQ